MGARYPYYLLADSPEGQGKEAELQGKAPSVAPAHGSIRHGFVYERYHTSPLNPSDRSGEAGKDLVPAQLRPPQSPDDPSAEELADADPGMKAPPADVERKVKKY